MSTHLTKAQMNAVEWALDPMDDRWCSEGGAEERDGPIYPESALPCIKHDDLFLSTVPEINEDLLYRLEVQLPDMCSQGNSPRNGATAALRAAAKIRQAMKEMSNERA